MSKHFNFQIYGILDTKHRPFSYRVPNLSGFGGGKEAADHFSRDPDPILALHNVTCHRNGEWREIVYQQLLALTFWDINNYKAGRPFGTVVISTSLCSICIGIARTKRKRCRTHGDNAKSWKAQPDSANQRRKVYIFTVFPRASVIRKLKS